jgi:hypothetical protein
MVKSDRQQPRSAEKGAGGCIGYLPSGGADPPKIIVCLGRISPASDSGRFQNFTGATRGG